MSLSSKTNDAFINEHSYVCLLELRVLTWNEIDVGICSYPLD